MSGYTSLSNAELKTVLQSMQSRLEKKRLRELNYLHRRKARGVQTPTDELMDQDQGLEQEILDLLSEMIGELKA